MSTVILIVTSSKLTILYESSILSSPFTLDITFFFPTRYSRHYIEFVSCSFTCLHCSMKCTCPLRSFSPYFSHHADFGSWRFSCWLLGKNVHVLFFYNDFSHLTLDIALVLFTWFSVACCCINCLFGCSRCIILGYGRGSLAEQVHGWNCGILGRY